MGLVALAAPSASAQSEEEATRARLAAAYAADPSLSNGCSLAEGERRAGLVDEAAGRLDALLAAARSDLSERDDDERATLSACHFNRARIHEDRGQLRPAYEQLVAALSTPNATRRRIVEERLVAVAARLVTAEGCARLSSRFSSEALLRFADNAALRRCVAASRRAQPFCRTTAADDIPETGGYGTRRIDANTVVVQDEHFIVVVTTRGSRVTAFECRLPVEEEQLSTARFLQVGSTRVLEVSTRARVSYSCDEDDCDGGDCRCSDDSETVYFLGPRNELLLALVPGPVEPGNMAALDGATRELTDESAGPTTVDGNVLVINGRRLRIVRGALVPAP